MTRTFGTFLFTGVIWAGLVRVIPAGAVRDVLLIGLGLGFAAAYLFLLVRRVRWLLRRQGSVAVQLGLLLFDVLLMVGTFALVYSTTGLLDNASPERQVVHSFPLALYYSVVTFTTLGYGDFYPIGAGRVLAAAEAAIGYVVLGVIASTAATVLSPHNPAGGIDEAAASNRKEHS